MHTQQMLDEQLNLLIKAAVRQAVAEAFADQERRQQSEPEYIVPREVSRRSRLAVQTIYQRHSNGTIPGAIRDGGKLLFRREVIDKWIANGCPKDITRF